MYYQCRWEVKIIKEYLFTVLLFFGGGGGGVNFWRRQDTIQVTRRVVSDQGLTHARWIQPGYMVPETVLVHGLWCPKTVLKDSCTYPALDGE